MSNWNKVSSEARRDTEQYICNQITYTKRVGTLWDATQKVRVLLFLIFLYLTWKIFFMLILAFTGTRTN